MKSFCLLLLFFTVNTFAANEIGYVTKIIGDVYKVSADKKEVKVAFHDEIRLKDTLLTKNKSIVSVKLGDDTVFTIAPNSKFIFHEMILSDSKRTMNFELALGKVRGVVSKSKSSDNNVKIQTKTMVMGIRGTEILLNHSANGKNEFSEAALMSGVADITYKDSGVTYQLKPGDYLVSMANPPKNFNPLLKLPLESQMYKVLEASGNKAQRYNQQLMNGEMMLAGSKDGKDGKAEADPEMSESYFLAGPGIAALEKIQEKQIKSDFDRLRKRRN